MNWRAITRQRPSAKCAVDSRIKSLSNWLPARRWHMRLSFRQTRAIVLPNEISITFQEW